MAVRARFHRLIRRFLSAVARGAARFAPHASPWDRVEVSVPAFAFGPGSSRPFSDYLEGASDVSLGSIDEIIQWLLACEYARDVDLFQERDVWQHPTDFERRRRGDCEDFALWAWRKLAELRVDAEFYVGRVRAGDAGAVRQHAWVVYRVDESEFLFEPAERSRPRMIRELAEARHDYIPHFAVNHRAVTSAFGGYLLDARAHDRRGAGPRSISTIPT